MVYLDNAATSWPKPQTVIEAMVSFMERIGANPGRSGHRLSLEAARIIFEARELLANIFGVSDPNRIVFTKNATEAINIVLKGLLKPGDHVITSSMEHNSVMRPLRSLERKGVSVSVVRCFQDGSIRVEDIEREIKFNTKAVIVTHASNVTGTLMPIKEISERIKRNGLIFCVDAAQTAGSLTIDVEKLGIDVLFFTGHKSLFGPQGTGGLYIRKGLEYEIEPQEEGGTGSRSEFEEHPDFMPDRFEAGTPNTVGIAGLLASLKFLKDHGIEKIREKELKLTDKILAKLSAIRGVKIYGPKDPERMIPIISFSVEGISPSDISLRLDEEFNIMTRPGLHCSPSAHKTIGTFPQGTVRLSLGLFTDEGEIDFVVEAIKKIVKG
ncbi:MAG: aminotransferase class V-fold PLP-dependent enzyme [Desulfobacterota bacterium]|nr:aminotransferase class V-fold PLP-dependent enzyme [Thermodesulfobacteriota bacterium]MDW8002074.1 aminotransferase class V-fold PLP-dependent enzyme [Deltaproteobacteria bacterium]